MVTIWDEINVRLIISWIWYPNNFFNITIIFFIVKFLKIIDTLVKLRANTLKPKWPKTELLSWKLKITTEDTRSSFSIRPSREKNVSRPTSSNTRNSISNGMRTCSKPRKRTPRPLVSSKTDTPKRLRRTDRFWRRNCHWLSNSAQSCWISRKFRPISLSRRSKLIK